MKYEMKYQQFMPRIFPLNCYLNGEHCLQCLIVLSSHFLQLCSNNSKICLDRLTLILLLPHRHEALGSELRLTFCFLKQPHVVANSFSCFWEITQLSTTFEHMQSQKLKSQKVRNLRDPFDHTIGLTPLLVTFVQT